MWTKKLTGVLLFGLLLASTAQATLLSRLGGAAAYDDVLDITWLTDASALGTGDWDSQVTAAANYSLTVGGLTVDDWRLATMSATSPATSVFDCSGGTAADCAAAGNELGYMYHHNMDGSGDNTGTQTVDGVNLTGIQSGYWSGTEFDPDFAWRFSFRSGIQSISFKSSNVSGWAVRSGDVGAAVPAPATLLLMAAGLGLLGVGRSGRRR